MIGYGKSQRPEASEGNDETDLLCSIHATDLHFSHLREPPASHVLSALCNRLPVPLEILESDDPAFLLQLVILLAFHSYSYNDTSHSETAQTRQEEVGVFLARYRDD